MDIKLTVDYMNGADYKDRFAAEYFQTKIRYDKLHKMVVKYESNTLDFTPDCSLELLKKQLSAMGQYLYILEIRAEIENINLSEYADMIENSPQVVKVKELQEEHEKFLDILNTRIEIDKDYAIVKGSSLPAGCTGCSNSPRFGEAKLCNCTIPYLSTTTNC